jgi:hypothetical protein
VFDWMRFFEQHRIEFNQSGPNVSRDNVTVHCPFCGTADQSKHLSVNLSGKGWRCWKSPNEHRGKSPARLVQGLLNCTWARACALTGESILIPDDFMARVRDTITPPEAPETIPLKLPKEFKPFVGKPSARPFERYMVKKRGFDYDDMDRLHRYDVRYCTTGAYRNRVIFPVWFEKRLMSWTGRHIGDSTLRYKALTVDPDKARDEGYKPAVGAISHYLLWYDMLRKIDADTIALVEGPMDALKVCILGKSEGICATCFFTSEPTESQVDLLHTLLRRFKRKITLLDRGTFATGIRIASGLSSLGVTSYELPSRLKDPGEFDVSTFRKFALALRRGRA